MVAPNPPPASVADKLGTIQAEAPPQKIEPGINADTGLTRAQSAKILKLSQQTLKNYEDSGLLHPYRVQRYDALGRPQHVVVYDPDEIAKVAEERQHRLDKGGANDTRAWMTRSETADYLGVATQTLKNYEERGLLTPTRVFRKDVRGHEQSHIVYEPKEVLKLPRAGKGRALPREEGEIQASMYELFEEGLTNNQIVVRLRQTSDRVRDLRERWLNDGGADLLITKEAKSSLENLLGPFKDVTEIIERLELLVNRPENTPNTSP